MKLRCNIQRIIEQRGLRKGFVAQKLNISTKQLRNYEVQISYPPADKLYMLARVLDVSADELYEWVEENDHEKNT